MDWHGRRVLVTGGAGFLGATLCHALAARGADVVAVDAMLPEGGAHQANLDDCAARLVIADLRDTDLAPLCDGVDAVFDLAAQTSHMGSQADPVGDLDHNARARLRLILALREAAPQARVVYASTRQFYGRPQSLPVSEAHPIVPPDANGVAKYAAEQYWLLEHRVHGRHVASLRLTNCYGPRLRVRDAKQTFLGIWIRRVLEGEPFEVWGGEQLRDLTYAEDVTEAFLVAAEKAAEAAVSGQVFNLGGSPPTSLLDLARRLIAANGGKGEFVTKEFPADRAPIDIGSYAADDRAFRTATGWAPRIDLDEGLRRSLAWYRPRLADYL